MAKSTAITPFSRILPQLLRPKDNEGLSYFGPGVEVAPIATSDTPARGWQYWPFLNQNFTPRPDAEYTAQQLRALATYPLARMCIDNSKDIICNLPRQIRAVKKPGEKNVDVDKRAAGDTKLKMLNDFFDCPDGDHLWDDWLRPFLDDMYVIDAASWLVERDRAGRPQILRYMDGAFVNVQIDERGVVSGYQALWSGSPSTNGGIPFVDLTKDQLLYCPRNIVPRNTVSSFLYGMSPTEQQAIEIQIGSARLGFVLSYYTDGEIPDGIHVIPPNVSGDQLRATQKAMESELTGLANLYKRHHMLLHQGFVDRSLPGASGGDQILFPKAVLLTDPEQENHIRKIAFAYGTPTQRLLKAMNRASAQTNQEAAEEEGYMPVGMWVKRRVDFVIARIFGFGFGEYELTYDTQRELDVVKRSTADKNDVDTGITTRDEARINRGLDPVGGDAAKLMITTTTGTTPVDLAGQAKHAQDMNPVQPADPEDDEPAAPKGKGKRVVKRAAPRINPELTNPTLQSAKHRLEHALTHIFTKQRETVALEASRLLKVRKAEDGESVASKLYKAIEIDFADLPHEARSALEAAAIAGVNEAVLQLGFADSAKISSINRAASDWAAERAAELVGMKYNAEGELIANPSAKYAINETTRDRLREIVSRAFAEKTPFADVIADIRDADIFSEARATLIATTEIANAQVKANFGVWKHSGAVHSAKWLAVGPDPCPVCETNDGQVRKLGERFPSGDVMPTAHPNCYCILQAVMA